MPLDSFVHDPNATAGRLVISMSGGAMRLVSGKMAQQSYEVRTPTATIGLRGTIFAVVVAANEDDSTSTSPSTSTSTSTATATAATGP